MTFVLALQNIHFHIKIDPMFENISWSFYLHLKCYYIMPSVFIIEINYRKYGGRGVGGM
jgi:hypothetical protein